MRVGQTSALIAEIVLGCVVACVNAWTLHKSWLFSERLKERKKQRRVPVSPAKGSERDNSVFLVNLTVLTNALFLAATLVSIVSASLYLRKSLKQRNVRPFLDDRVYSVEWVFTFLYIMTIVSGFVLITFVGSERLWVTFGSTQYRYSERTISTVRWTILLLMLLSSVPMAAYLRGGGTDRMSLYLYAVFEPLVMIVYVSLNSWVLRNFVENSFAVAAGMQPSEVITDESAMKLANTALRVAVACSTPLMSSFSIMIVAVIGALLQSVSVLHATRLLYVVDFGVNSFCVLCMFADSERYYHLVFGDLHRWLFRSMFDC